MEMIVSIKIIDQMAGNKTTQWSDTTFIIEI